MQALTHQALTHDVSASALPAVDGAALEPLTFAALAHWPADDHAAAFSAFLRTCEIIAGDAASQATAVRAGAPRSPALRSVCVAALAESGTVDSERARRFFEQHFRPFRVLPAAGEGFLTGYYEPEFPGRLSPGGGYDTPLLARPGDLVTIAEGESIPGLDPELRAARRVETPAGIRLEPFPDRAAIEDGALDSSARPLVYLDAVDAFMAHVQGSVRVRLTDAGGAAQPVRRFAYAGRNGHAYTSVARLVVGETGMAPAELTAPKLVAWLRDHPDDARRLMRRNRSYIFFRAADELAPGDGPIGGAGVQLTPGRALAVDRRIWSYGLPVWVEARLPRPGRGSSPDPRGAYNFRRLMIAQDTGSAIVGPARADIFFGSGAQAGALAGLVRHAPERFVVLLPADAERGT